MSTTAQLLADVRPVLGECLRYHVRSRSRPEIWHLVDLGENDGAGRCGCEDHEFRKGSCHHIARAQKHLALTVARNIIEQRKAYENRKTQLRVDVVAPEPV